MGRDIRQIEAQNRGLQIQTDNQRILANEVLQLLVPIFCVCFDLVVSSYTGQC